MGMGVVELLTVSSLQSIGRRVSPSLLGVTSTRPDLHFAAVGRVGSGVEAQVGVVV